VTRIAQQLADSGDPELGRLRAALAQLRYDFAHLGPAEWQLCARTWGSDPRLPLHVLKTLSLADNSHEPIRRAARQAERNTAAVAAIRHAIRSLPAATARFDAALAGTPAWLFARQRGRQIVSRLINEQRAAVQELGRRHLASGLLDGPDQICMVFASELNTLVDDPTSLGEALRMRSYDHHALSAYRPPFATVGAPASAIKWAPTPPNRPMLGHQQLTGRPTSGGTACGPARVQRSPDSSVEIGPGEVLVLRDGGPRWVPLLPLAVAVVIDDGAALSSVSVACRDLGIPCIASTTSATGRIPNQGIVEVDGSTGAVRLSGTERTPSSHHSTSATGRSTKAGELEPAPPKRKSS
jgi:pyruvate,water dikinase